MRITLILAFGLLMKLKLKFRKFEKNRYTNEVIRPKWIMKTSCSRRNFTQIERQISSKHKRTEAQMSDSVIRSLTVEDARFNSYFFMQCQLQLEILSDSLSSRSCLLAQFETGCHSIVRVGSAFSLPLQLSPILADKQSETSGLGHFSTAVEWRLMARSLLL